MDTITYELPELGVFDICNLCSADLREVAKAPGLKLVSISTSNYRSGSWVKDETPYLTVSGLKSRKAIPITAIDKQEEYKLVNVQCHTKLIVLSYTSSDCEQLISYYATPDHQTDVVIEDSVGNGYKIFSSPMYWQNVKNWLHPNRPLLHGYTTSVLKYNSEGMPQREYKYEYRLPDNTTLWSQLLTRIFAFSGSQTNTVSQYS